MLHPLRSTPRVRRCPRRVRRALCPTILSSVPGSTFHPCSQRPAELIARGDAAAAAAAASASGSSRSSPHQRPTPNARCAWILASAKRLHSHDVRALAHWPLHTPLSPAHAARAYALPAGVAPVLASGGLDITLVLAQAASARVLANLLATSAAGTLEDGY
jgi:hypothetical protein